MAGCGYVCPACGGKEIDDDGRPCNWCQPDNPVEKKVSKEDLQQWIEKVHEGPCCSDTD